MKPSEIRQTAEFAAAELALEPYRNLPYQEYWQEIDAIMIPLTAMCDPGWEACNCHPDGFNKIGFFGGSYLREELQVDLDGVSIETSVGLFT